MCRVFFWAKKVRASNQVQISVNPKISWAGELTWAIDQSRLETRDPDLSNASSVCMTVSVLPCFDRLRSPRCDLWLLPVAFSQLISSTDFALQDKPHALYLCVENCLSVCLFCTRSSVNLQKELVHVRCDCCCCWTRLRTLRKEAAKVFLWAPQDSRQRPHTCLIDPPESIKTVF